MRKFMTIAAIVALIITESQIVMTTFADENKNIANPAETVIASDEAAETPTVSLEDEEGGSETPTVPLDGNETEITTEAVTETQPATESATQPTTDSNKEPIPIDPACEHIIKNDINGRALMSVPEGATAEIKITYSSPEYDAHVYYDAVLQGGNDYSFEFEGRDITDDDYRWYTVSVILTGGIYNIASEPYTDTFYIPDKNDNPDSFSERSYIFTIDGEESENPWSVLSSNDNVNEIAFHLNYVNLGDLNGDYIIDSVDASIVLSEYSLFSTTGVGIFNEKQKIEADIDNNGVIDSTDASQILHYYSKYTIGETPSWD